MFVSAGNAAWTQLLQASRQAQSLEFSFDSATSPFEDNERPPRVAQAVHEVALEL